jgi:hypothetical protein
MKILTRTPALFLILAAACIQPVSAQTGITDTVKLEKTISILNDKVFFHFPAKAMASPRVADIMATDPNANMETRIIYDLGKLRVVFFAQEIFTLSGNNMFNDITKEDPKNAEYTRRQLTSSDSIITVLTTPLVFDSTAGGILINSLLVKTPDNTVFKMDAYINPEAFKLRNEFMRFTENIFKTVTKGTRKTELGARAESYKLLVGDNKISFSLPKNYVVTVDEKFDFIVYKLNKYKDISDTSYTSLTIYNGANPSMFHTEYEMDEKTATKVNGKFLQNNVEWLLFEEKETGFFLKEQVIPLDNIQKGLVLHVAMLSNQKNMIDELSKIVENIKLVK